MATKTVSTSLVVDFQSDVGDGVLKAEFDDREDGYNNGITSFNPGDNPAFLVFASSNVETVTSSSDHIESSEGSISYLGSGTIEKEQFLQYADEKEQSLDYPASGSVSTSVRGNISPNAPGETKITLAEAGTGVIKATYNTSFRAFRLNGAQGDYPVVISIKSEATV